MKDELQNRMLDALEAANECVAALDKLLQMAKTDSTPELADEIEVASRNCEDLSNQYIDAYRAYARHQARID